MRTTSHLADRSARSLRRSASRRLPTCSRPCRPVLSYSTAIRSSGMTMSGHTSTCSKNGRATRTALSPAVNSRRSARSWRSRASTADAVAGAHALVNASPTATRGVMGQTGLARDAVRGRASPAGRTRGGLASTEHSGHHDERRRSRAGRLRCSVGVAANRWPASHCQSRSTSAAGGIWVSVIPALNSGWYCRISAGIRRPRLAVGADRERYVGSARELTSRPPGLDPLGHVRRVRGAADARRQVRRLPGQHG